LTKSREIEVGLTPYSVSAIHPFQQVLLFILFLCGDYSVISLVMVLIRKRYFRTHCSQLLTNDQFRRTNTIQMDQSSVFDRAFTWNPATPKTPKFNRKSRRGLISGPTDARAMGGFIPDEENGTRNHSDENGEKGKERVVEDSEELAIPSRIQESPVSMTRLQTRSRVSFRPSIEITRPVPLGDVEDELEGPTADGSIDSGKYEGDEPTPSTGLSHTRTITIDPPTAQYQARQRIRSQTRGISMSGPSPKTQSHGTPLVQYNTLPSPIPKPERNKHTGLGGFNPTHLFSYLLPNRTKSTITRHFSRPGLSRKMTILTNANANAGSYTTKSSGDSEGMWGGMMTGAARWMPDTLASLVVGRNSRFFTEELDDEELEQIGGVEYRALRLLSYAVAAVSPITSGASQSGTKRDGAAGQGRLMR
jgi:hypothetical protein